MPVIIGGARAMREGSPVPGNPPGTLRRSRWRGGQRWRRMGQWRGVQRWAGDRGAVGVVVAIALASGVLLGFLALVVDVGQIYVEKQELQTGADAAALAVAKACALLSEDCETTGDLVAVAQGYADRNSSDGVSRVVDVCGRLPGRLFPCGEPAGNLTDCLGTAPAPPTPFVEVRLATALPDGRFVLPPAFAQAMAGNSGFDGASVGACARATWRVAPEVPVLAMTISTCEFDDATNSGTEFVPPPPYPPDPEPSAEYTVQFLADLHGGCGDPPESWNEAGGAAFLTGLTGGNSDCEVSLPNDGIVAGTFLFWLLPTLAPPQACLARLHQAWAHNEIVYLPVHDGIDGLFTTSFHQVYLAPFVVTGFTLGPDSLPGNTADKSWLRQPPDYPCDNVLHRCVSGLFVGPALPLSDLTGDAIVELIG